MHVFEKINILNQKNLRIHRGFNHNRYRNVVKAKHLFKKGLNMSMLKVEFTFSLNIELLFSIHKLKI